MILRQRGERGGSGETAAIWVGRGKEEEDEKEEKGSELKDRERMI